MDEQKPKSSVTHHAHSRDDNFALPSIPDDENVSPYHENRGHMKQNPWQHFTHWVETHKKESIAIAAVIVLAGGSTALYFALKPHPKPAAAAAPSVTTTTTQPQPTGPTKYYSPLTGMPVNDQATTKQEVTGIMIENSDWARPQSGLKDAGVVFEAIAEGGITRFAALYQEAKPQLIGPVRSVRPYYLDWMGAFDASIVHVGGSANALNTVRSGAFKDADEFFNGDYFWRASDRNAPHNVYTNFTKLDALNAAKGYTGSNFTGFSRKDESPPTSPNASKIDIVISSADFNVHYDYDKGCNCYSRSEGGQPHKDREAGQITPKVVIAMKVPTQLGFEDGYREQMTTIGSGTAYVFQDGTATVGTWTKTGQKNQIVFKNSQGQEISLNRGQTWISVTAPDQSVTWQ